MNMITPRIKTKIDRLLTDLEYRKYFPCTEPEAMRLKGIGEKSIPYLRSLNLISDAFDFDSFPEIKQFKQWDQAKLIQAGLFTKYQIRAALLKGELKAHFPYYFSETFIRRLSAIVGLKDFHKIDPLNHRIASLKKVIDSLEKQRLSIIQGFCFKIDPLPNQ